MELYFSRFLQSVQIYWGDVILHGISLINFVHPQWRLDVIKYCHIDVTEYGFNNIITIQKKYFLI